MPTLPLRKSDLPSNPPARIDGRWHYPYSRIGAASVRLTATAEGRYGDYFASGEGSRSNHVFEFLTTHPVATSESGETHAYGRWVIATLASNAASVNFGGAIAAATATGSGSVDTNQFLADTRGIDDAHWAGLRSLSGKLDADGARSLGAGLSEAVGWCVTDAATGKTEPAAVLEFRQSDYDDVESTVFALNRIKRGDTREGADAWLSDRLSRRRTRDAHLRIDPLIVAATYHRFGLHDEMRPSKDQQSLARRILGGRDELPASNDAVRGYWYEVEPYRMTDGGVPSLQRLGKDAKVHAWPVDAEALGPSKGNTGGSELRVQTALRVEASGLVDAGIDADARYWSYGFLSEYPVNGEAGSMVLNEKYAAGFRVRLRSVGANAELDVAAIAAKATTEALDVAFEIEALGIDLSGLKQLPALVTAAVGSFGVDTLTAVGGLYEQASAILSDHTNTAFSPVLTAVELNLGHARIQALVATRASIESRVAVSPVLESQTNRLAGPALLALGD